MGVTPDQSYFSGQTGNFAQVWQNAGLMESQVKSTPAALEAWSALHETLHALGARSEQSVSGLNVDHNLSVMAYGQPLENQSWTSVSVFTGIIPVEPVTRLQLYDIWDLQQRYGANFSTRNLNSNYDRAWIESHGDFISIWDGGGSDTLDASGYQSSAILDLRQGEFSSIGDRGFFDFSSNLSRPKQNVSIAWGAVIEKANGTLKSDVIIGNAVANTLSGGEGDDAIFGGTEAYSKEREGALARIGASATQVESGGLEGGTKRISGEDWEYVANNGPKPSAAADTDTIHGDAGNDGIYGGAGNDSLYGDSGDDLLVGGDGADFLDGGTGKDVIVAGGGDSVARGDVEDSIYYKSYDPSNIGLNKLGFGIRSVDVNDSQDWLTQIGVMRSSVADFVGSMGEHYHLINGDTGLSITMKSGDVITIPQWAEGEYGIYLETTRNRVAPSAFEQVIGYVGGVAYAGLQLATNFFVGGTNWIASFKDPIWPNGGLGRYSLTQLSDWLGTSSPPGRTNNIYGTPGNDALTGHLSDDRLLGSLGDDVLNGLYGDDYVFGDQGSDVLDGGPGADRVEGGDGDDTLTGGAGNDVIIGGAGKDVILLKSGDGIDQINSDLSDIIRFDGSVSSTSAVIRGGGAALPTAEYGSVSSRDLLIQYGSDSVTISNGSFGSLEFADGTVKTAASLAKAAIAGSTTSGNDAVLGSALADRITGSTGNDYLNGLGGNDRYYFGRGDGQDRVEDHDVVNGDSLADVLVFGATIAPTDIIVSSSLIATGSRAGERLIRLAISGTSDWVEFPVTDIEEVRFQDGTSWTDLQSKAYQSLSTSGNDTIVMGKRLASFRPGAGNDVIKAGTGPANIKFGYGSGTDRIELTDGMKFGTISVSPSSSVEFDSGIGIGDLRLARLGDGFSATLDGTSDHVDVVRTYSSTLQPNWRETDIAFKIPGDLLYSKTLEQIADYDTVAAQHLVGTSAANAIAGGALGDRISGGTGNDTLTGNDGNDLLFGGVGNDSLIGGNGRDLLFGETGDDVLDGGADDDELFSGAGVDTLSGGAGNDILHGNGAGTLTGGVGSDTIISGLGDKIQFNIGDGADTLQSLSNPQGSFDGSTVLKRSEIVLGTGITTASTTLTLQGWSVFVNINGSTTDTIKLDHLLQGRNVPSIRFQDGTLWTEKDIYQRLFSPNTGNDTPAGVGSVEPDWSGRTIKYVYGGLGNDTLQKPTGADEVDYVFAPGDGNDTITGRGDNLILDGFDPDALRIQRAGTAMQDFILSFVGSTDTLRINSQEIGTNTNQVANYVYMNGTQLAASDLRALAISQTTTTGNDTIYGFDGPGGVVDIGFPGYPTYLSLAGNDAIKGGLGNDLMIGGSGDDTYVVAAGDGVDTIRDLALGSGGSSNGYDVLRFGQQSTIATFARSTTDANDLVIKFNASTDQVTVDDYFTAGQIEEIEFADGVVLTPQEMAQLAIVGSATATADIIKGTADPDTMKGAVGNDTLDGFGGADCYLYNLGDGSDTISDTGTAESNTFVLGAGITFASLGLSKSGNDLKIKFNATDIVTVTGQFAGSANPPIGQFVFADGSRKTAAEIAQAALDQAATSGNDTITGFGSNDRVSGAAGNDSLIGGAGNDTLTGGIGNDTMDGGVGADTYAIARGDGVDRIASTGDASALDSVTFDATIASRDVQFVRTPSTSPDLVINVRGTAQSITVANYFGGTAVATFAFADGTTFTSADVTAALANAAPTLTTQAWRVEIGEGNSTRFGVPTGLFADDADVAALTYRATLSDGSPLPSWLTFDGRVFQANANDTNVGTWSLTLTATDRFGASVDRNVKLDLVNSTEAPAATASLPTQTAPIGSAFSYSLPAGLFTDQDTLYLTTATPVAGNYATAHGSIVVQTTGAYTYTPTGGYTGADSAYIPFNIGTSKPLERSFGFTSAGTTLSGNLPANLAPVKDVVTLSARLANGAALPSWLSFNGTTFSGTPASGNAGPLAIQVIATDASGLATIVPFAIKVGTVNSAPTSTALGTIHATEDLPFYLAVPATTFADSNANDRLTLSATKSDGSALPSWLTFDGVAFSGTPDNGTVGILSVKVTATDIFGTTSNSTLTLIVDNVNDAPAAGSAFVDQLATQGQPFSYTVAAGSFIDPDVGDTLSITATQSTGDPLPSWLSFSGGTLSGTPGPTDPGIYRIRLTATDAGGLATYQDITLGVVDVNDAPTVIQSLTMISAPANMQTDFHVPAGLFADSDDPSYSVSVTLSDGSSLPSWITLDADGETLHILPIGPLQLSGKDSAAALTNLKVTAKDTRGATVSTILPVQVVAPIVQATLNDPGTGDITGTGLAERIDSGPGDDSITSNGGADRIVFVRGYGQDTLYRGNAQFTDHSIGNIIEFAADILPSDITLSRETDPFSPNYNPDNLVIKINGSSDQLTVIDQFAGPAAEEPMVRELRFANGTVISAAQILSQFITSTSGNDQIVGAQSSDSLAGSAGNDTILGGNGNDTIDGGTGDDVMFGDVDRVAFKYFNVTGADIFLFNRGSGHDKIVASNASSAHVQDTLRFGANIAPSDLIVTHIPGYATESDSATVQDPGSLLIQIAGTQDSVQISRQFFLKEISGKPTQSSGIERFEFADGTVMNRAQLESLITLTPATSGDDRVSGGASADRLQGGLGNDTLVGEDGADTYVYNAGDGNDVIRETEQQSEGLLHYYVNRAGDIVSFDALSFGAGIGPSNLIFTRPDTLGENLVITFNNQLGSVTIEGEFRNIFRGPDSRTVTSYYGTENSAIDQIRFADGTNWSLSDIYAYSTKATSGNDTLDGFFRAAETLDGGAGDDLLVGRNGDDTYVFARGYGNDSIKELSITDDPSPSPYTPADRIRFSGVNAADVTTKIGTNGDFVFTITNTGETLTIKRESQFANFQAIQFADTTWNSAQFQTKWTIAAATAGNDLINGFVANDSISGGDGNDTLDGNQGRDTLSGGLGADTLIVDYQDSDTANGDDGDDVFKVNAILEYDNTHRTNVEARGTLQAPVLAFGAETGSLDGGNGTDTLTLGGKLADYWGGSYYVWDNGNGYTFANGGLSIRNIEKVIFSDGELSVASLAAATSQFRPGTKEGTAGNDLLNGTNGPDALYGLDGNDTINGLDGDDYLIGGLGTDVYDGGLGTDILDFSNETTGWSINLATHQAIQGATTETFVNMEGAYGSSLADTITGSAAADTIRGNVGDDIIDAGDGNDIIEFAVQYDVFSNVITDGFDSIVGGLGTDTVRATADNTVIGLKAISGVETVTANGFANVSISGSTGNDTLDFSSTTIVGISAIKGNSGADTITGTAFADTILGGAGNDSLAGGFGDDVFQVDFGEGYDAINGGSGTDTIQALSSGTTIGLTSISGIETITAGAFTGVTIAGSTGADVLDFTGVTIAGISQIFGDAGNDTITGTAFADTIAGGNGNDSLMGADGNDVFTVGTGAGSDVIDGGLGSDTIKALVNNTVIGLTTFNSIESIISGGFSGVSIAGTSVADTLDFSAVTLTGITKIDAAAGNDTVIGSAASDTILGSAGDDSLIGGNGNDAFQYTGTSNGFDNVDGGIGTDTISALANSTVIGLSALTSVETISSGGFTGVYISGSANADTLNFSSTTLTGITKIDGAAGNDNITGSGGADTILGSGGDDTIAAGSGNDVIQYTGSSNGFDSVDGGLGTDTISALANSTVIGLSAITGVETISAGAFTGVYVAGSANADALNFSATTLTAITKIDGGAANDTITGSAGADTILGSGGDDSLLGGNGNDAFQFTGTASGFDAIDGGAGTDTISALANSTVIGLSSLTGVETISGGAFTGVYVSGSGNADTLNFSAVTLTAITKIQSGAGADSITGSAGADTILGGTEADTLDGGNGNDSITGDDGDDRLIGGAGNDTLNGANGIDTVDYSYATANLTVSLAVTTAQTVATGDVDTLSNLENLIGGTGADTITGSTANNTLNGGGGNDRITGGAGNDIIDGAAGTIDVAVFAGLQASYTITTVSGTTTIVDNQATTDGNDGTDTLVGVEKAEFKGGVQVALAPPIVLDLDGDGVELVNRTKSKAKFDWDGDGKRDSTGWVGKDDGLLVYDRNGDGKVSGANELSFVDDKPGAKSDLDGLSAFDSNGDGIFSSADDKFASFKVWRDKDGDGKSDKGELISLAQAGVASITLAGQAVSKSWGWNDNLIVNTGSFTRTDGSTAALGDVALNYAASAKSNRSNTIRAASRFAEAIGSFQPQGAGMITLAQQDMEWSRQPLVADHRAEYRG